MEISPDFASDRTMLAGSAEDGVLISTDAGESWEQAAGPFDGAEVRALALAPDFARDGFGMATVNGGAVVTRDGGREWSRLASVRGGAELLAVALSPDFSRDGTAVIGAAGGVLLLSTDGAESWTPCPADFDQLDIYAVGFSPAFASDRTLVVGGVAEGRVVLYRSQDGGSTWQRYVTHDDDARWLSLAIPITYGPEDEFFCFATGSRVFKPLQSQEDIWSSSRPSGAQTAVLHVAVSPDFGADRTMFVATSDGVFKSVDRGESWIEMNVNLANRSVLHIALSPQYAQDRAVYVITVGGEIWRCHDAAPGPEAEVLI
jgi:photosystem II stability/assembly factor-like uncharacterized protein